MDLSLVYWNSLTPERPPLTQHMRIDDPLDPVQIVLTDTHHKEFFDLYLLPSDSASFQLLDDPVLAKTSKLPFAQLGVPDMWDGFAVLTVILAQNKLIVGLCQDPVPPADFYRAHLEDSTKYTELVLVLSFRPK